MSDDAHEDYIWHFRLSKDGGVAGDDALAEMVTTQLQAMLRCVTLVNDGQALRVTGFRFLNEREGEHPLFGSLAADAHGTDGV
jgi:hypothetical protein